MLQQILSDANLLFFISHAFIIGAILGFIISKVVNRDIKQKLKSQSKAYEDLMNSLESAAPEKKYGGNYMQVIHMEAGKKKVSGLSY